MASSPGNVTPRCRAKTKAVTRAPFKSPFRKTETAGAEDAKSIQKEIQSLKARDADLSEKIHELQQQGYKEEELEMHINKLHEYNEIKDVAQMLLGQIAVRKGVTTKELYEQYELNLED